MSDSKTHDPRQSDEEHRNKILLVSIFDCRVPITIDQLHQIFSFHGEVTKIVTFVKASVFKALVQFRSIESAANAKDNLDGRNWYSGCCLFQIHFSKLTDLEVKTNTARARDFTLDKVVARSGGGGGGGGSTGGDPRTRGSYQSQAPLLGPYPGAYEPDYGSQKSPVLLVNNLVETKVTPDVIFTLFGVYGDVQRVKIFYNKQSSALVQLADPYQASLAQAHLNHVELMGKSLSVLPSKNSSIFLSSQQDSELAKDYSGSRLHRFRYSSGKYLRNICPPGSVLHVSKLAEDVTSDDLRDLFGTKVVAIQFFKTDRRMAFVRMGTVADAVEALIRTHNTKLKDTNIVVSFSPKRASQVQDEEKTELDEPETKTQAKAAPAAPAPAATKQKETGGTAAPSTQAPRTAVRGGAGAVGGRGGATTASAARKPQATRQQGGGGRRGGDYEGQS